MMQWLKFIQLKGHVTASMAFMAVPVEAVQNLIPKGMKLAAQTFTPAGTHPVLFAFTYEENVHFAFRRVKFFKFKAYWEFVLQVPYIDQGDGLSIFNYPVRLYLNRVMPMLVGLWGYGYPKRLARMEANPATVNIQDLWGRPLLSGQFGLQGVRGPASEFPHFQAEARPLLNRAFLTKYPPLPYFPGVLLCSTFDYGFNSSQTQVQAMPATVELHPRFAQQFLPGLVGKYNVPGIDQTPLGAFRLWSDWVLTPCSA